MTCREFLRRLVRVPDGAGGVGPPALHREQERLVTALDTVVDGRRAWREYLLSWAKKSGKSTTAAAIALWHLTSDPLVRDERLVGLSAWDEDQAGIVFTAAAGLVARHRWLAEKVRVLRGEMIFEERVREARTGGTYPRVHRLRQLARDLKGLHGEPWTCVVRDELWSDADHQLSEALIPSPTCANPILLACSYAPLASMRKPGVPLVDLLNRAEAGDASLFYSYIGGLGEAASWRVVPWITHSWVLDQERVFATSPSRYKRVVLNLPVTSDGDGLLTISELRDALDETLPAVPTPIPGTRYCGGLDLGLSNDHSALVVGHLDGEGAFVVDVCQVWRPTAGPIALTEVEAGVRAIAARFPLVALHVDQWNAKLLVERLQAARVPAKLVSVEQAMLNRIITAIKTAFARRSVRIGAREVFLLEQLESLKILETRSPRRDYLKFAPSGTGLDASQHDDAAVALGLALLQFDGRVGRVTMEEMRACNHELNGVHRDCYLAGGRDRPYPADWLCAACPAHRSVQRALAHYEARRGPLEGGVEAFVRLGLIAPNTWALNRKVALNVRGWV